MLDTVDDWKTIPGLEVKPPDVCRYFVRVKKDILDHFILDHKLENIDRREAEDEYVNQNSFKLNQMNYSAVGDKKAFVLSHGRNIMILKVVGFAEAIVDYYKVRDLCAHVWIAHQRFPTKGRVWQWGLCQLSFCYGAPAAATHPAAISHRYGGIRTALRPFKPDIPLFPRTHYRSPGPHIRVGL